MNIKIRLYIAALCSAILMFSCKSDTEPQQTKENGVAENFADSTKYEIKKVKLYLENSASMAGYFRHKTEFSDMMDDVITQFNISSKFRDKLEAYTICEAIEKYNTIEDFQSALRLEPGHQIPIGKSSQLDKILQNIYENTAKGEISILVTDAIMSGTDEQLKSYFKETGQHYNQAKKNALKNDIFSIADSKKDEFFISVCAQKSSFQGTYYKLDNSRLSGTFDNRPYYIISIGDKNLYTEYISKTNDFFSCNQNIEYGLNYEVLHFSPTPFSTALENVQIGLDNIVDVKSNRRNFTLPFLVNLDIVSKNLNLKEILDESLIFLSNEITKTQFLLRLKRKTLI